MSDPQQQAIDPSKKTVKRTGKKKSQPAGDGAQNAQDTAGSDDVRPFEKGVGAVVIRNEYYRDGYRTLQKNGFVSCCQHDHADWGNFFRY